MLIKETTNNVINTDEIGRGSLIWAQHMSWDNGRSGIVENATEEKILVRYLPSTQNVQNHFYIHAADLVKGDWVVRYSSDGLETVTQYGGDSDES